MSGNFITRHLASQLEESLSYFPVVAILGPRQVGKSTLIKHYLAKDEQSIYLDLEKPSDLNKLNSSEVYFDLNKHKIICLDEIQRKPEFFPIIRSVVDQSNKAGQFIILGSASIDLLNQSSESLAGRIDYLELSPFLASETDDFMTLWFFGGFPKSYLAPSEALSQRWRENFIQTFLERDMPQFNSRIPANNLRRFWQLCAHYHAQLVNYSSMGKALQLSHSTIRHYMDMMSATFMLRLLPPFYTNSKKRLIKSPKLYIRDTGILHTLLGITKADDLFGHPVFGYSFESLVIENILYHFPDWSGSFYKTQSGAEIDLILSKGTRHIAIEIKATKSPTLQRGFREICQELAIDKKYVVSLVDETYSIQDDATVCNLAWFIDHFNPN